MKGRKKEIFLIIIFLSLFFLSFSREVFAIPERLEVQYPSFGKWKITPTSSVEEYIAYVYHFVIGIGGLVAFGALIYGGVLWMISGGAPAKVSEAKRKVGEGLAGILLLFSSYLILSIIDPNLTILRLGREQPQIIPLTGVYLCKEDCYREDRDCILKNCVSLSVGGSGRRIDFVAKKILFFPPKDFKDHYFALLYDRKEPPEKLQYRACGIIADGNYLRSWDSKTLPPQDRVGLPLNRAKYIQVFQTSSFKGDKNKGVTFCETQGCVEATINNRPAQKRFFSGEFNIYPFFNPPLTFKIKGLELDEGFYVLLFRKTMFRGKCLVLTKSEPNLVQYSQLQKLEKKGEEEVYEAEVNSFVLIPITSFENKK